MDNKELKIIPPEGYEIDKENSTFDTIKFKLIKKVTGYFDIAKSLFEGKECWFMSKWNIYKTKQDEYKDVNNLCTSLGQAQKLQDINKLMNVAKYLNEDWRANFEDCTQPKYCFYVDFTGVQIDGTYTVNKNIVYFKSRNDAEKAREILGEETIKRIFSNNW